MNTKTRILEFPVQNYNYICNGCGKMHDSYMISMQILGFKCMDCGSEQLDRTIDKRVVIERINK